MLSLMGSYLWEIKFIKTFPLLLPIKYAGGYAGGVQILL